jgi:hypothetical protein
VGSDRIRHISPLALGGPGRIVTGTERAAEVARILTRLTNGSLRLEVDGRLLAELDAGSRTVRVQAEPILGIERRLRALPSEDRPHLWEGRGLPGALARTGWRMTVEDGGEELVRVGHGVSALTGHLALSPRALWRLRRLL